MGNSVSSLLDTPIVQSFTPIEGTTKSSTTKGGQDQSKIIDQLKDYIKQLLSQMQPQGSQNTPSSSPSGSAPSPSMDDDKDSTDGAGKKHKHKHSHGHSHGMGGVHQASAAQPGSFGKA